MSDLPPTTNNNPSDQSTTAVVTGDTNGEAATKPEVHDCWYFLTTGCLKGDSCKFRHNPKVRNINILCVKYLRGECFDPECPFIHLTSLVLFFVPCYAQPTAPHPKPYPKPYPYHYPHPYAPQPQPMQRECAFFKRGCCKNGDNCPFLHILPTAATSTSQTSVSPVSPVSTFKPQPNGAKPPTSMSTVSPVSPVSTSLKRSAATSSSSFAAKNLAAKPLRVIDGANASLDPLGFEPRQTRSPAELERAAQQAKQGVSRGRGKDRSCMCDPAPKFWRQKGRGRRSSRKRWR
ncbi:uncharacterized protein [Blastocystis hominis]|uniref:C3H1-type domain-containing protein n=1 Tax=Blastocystis hominis TaxID=12968 RepID=D8M0C6_BLAHO|nr:uncharacterized protein [Blastocystis hominis]CBK21515.2 unnamed protein product [Blastocystis hominis]|eukprot:XP_012895563.1 uncharacterized protein [Blastocystis hominis]